MSGQKNFCLLGFTMEAEGKIKKIISEYNDSISLNWVSANDKRLDGVIINAGFLEAPQIQKYLSLIKCPIVCAHANDDGKMMAAKKNYYSFDLRLPKPNTTLWIDTLFGRYVKKPSSVGTTPDTSSISPSIPISTKEKSTLSEKKILRKICQGEKIVLRATSGDNITWVKPAEGLVFINYPRESVPGYDRWSWQEVEEDELPASARQLKIDLWLFETLWQSHIDGTQYINKSAYFQLNRWPQPLSRQGRTEALRLAACAQAYPVDVETLRVKTNYPIDTICRFLFATIYAGQTKEVSASSLPKRTDSITPPLDERKREEKRSLLQRFREKLGL